MPATNIPQVYTTMATQSRGTNISTSPLTIGSGALNSGITGLTNTITATGASNFQVGSGAETVITVPADSQSIEFFDQEFNRDDFFILRALLTHFRELPDDDPLKMDIMASLALSKLEQ